MTQEQQQQQQQQPDGTVTHMIKQPALGTPGTKQVSAANIRKKH